MLPPILSLAMPKGRNLRREQLGEQLELHDRPVAVARTDLANYYSLKELVGGPARIRT
jgi:hypothetical protein